MAWHESEVADRFFARLFTAVGPPVAAVVSGRPTGAWAGGGDLVELLRAATCVQAADLVLAEEGGLDWPRLAEAHRTRAFGRVQRRALIGRADCPGPMAALLLDPFDPLVAGRGSPAVDIFTTPHASQAGRYPPQVVLAAVSRVGEVRHAFFHHALLFGGFPAEQMLTTARRIDLLTAVFAYRTRWSCPAVEIFWPALGVLLRARLGRRGAAWWFVATRILRYRGGLDSLLARACSGDVADEASTVDMPELQVLAQAPGPVIAELLDGLPDSILDRLATVPSWWRRPRAVLARTGLAAGARLRREYAHWIREAHDGGPDVDTVVRLLPVAAGTLLAADLDLRVRWDVRLRRRLAQLCAGAVEYSGDLPGALYSCTDPVGAEAVLAAALPDHARPPWASLIAAHAARPLPVPVLCALADRAGFPPQLAADLPSDVLREIACRSRIAALQALGRNPLRPGFLTATQLDRLVLDGLVTIAEVFNLVRPAAPVLAWALAPVTVPDDPAVDLGLPPPHHNDTNTARSRALVRSAARTALAPMYTQGDPERLGDELARLLPTFSGTVSDLLARVATTEPTNHRPTDPPLTPPVP